MSSGYRFRDIYLVLLCGLPGTGKSVVAGKLHAHFNKRYLIIGQNEIRRRHGYKKMPKTFDSVLREIDRATARNLNSGRGVIFDSVNRRTSRRHQMYGVASCCGAKVITLEIICSEETAKRRISERSVGDGLLSDPNDPRVYDKLQADSDPVEVDFRYPGQEHVSYVQFDSETNKLTNKIVAKGANSFINKIRKILEIQK